MESRRRGQTQGAEQNHLQQRWEDQVDWVYITSVDLRLSDINSLIDFFTSA